MNLVRLFTASLTCAALLASSALHAQARGQAPRPSGAPVSGTQGAAGPYEPQICPWTVQDRSPWNWWSSAWNTICLESARSKAVALAWAQGLDERGAQLDAGARAARLGEMEEWLRRLAGKFRIEGEQWNANGNTRVRGEADCFGIGSGPGVSCVISVAWKTGDKDTNLDKTSNFAARPQLILFGLDPGTLEIQVTQLDSLAVAMRGFLLDGSVILEPLAPPEILVVNPALVDPFLSSASRGSPPPARRSALDRLLRVAPQSLDREIPTPLSRVAITPDGVIEIAFHVYPPDIVNLSNQPIQFALQLRREP